MQTYNDILNRIIEIIEISENIRRNSKNEVLDIENFSLIRHYPIHKDYVEEFNRLLNAERTYYLLYQNKDSNVGEKNTKLLEECRNNSTQPDFLELAEIINRSFKRTANELYEYLGYYVLREDCNRFIELCKKLHVGPCVALRDLNPDDARKEINNSLFVNKEQGRRIKKYLFNEVEEKDEKVFEEQFIVVPEKQIEEASQEELAESNGSYVFVNADKPVLSCDFREIIYLGMSGQLTLKMVQTLKDLLTNAEFKELINLLIEYNIFTKGELSEIVEVSNNRVVTDIDELVGYFAIKDSLNVEGLKSLIPTIGLWNYHYMIDQLFKYGAIDFETYKDYLIENNLIDIRNGRN